MKITLDLSTELTARLLMYGMDRGLTFEAVIIILLEGKMTELKY